MTTTKEMAKLGADKIQIGRFVLAMFSYADPGTHVALRAFYDNREGVFEIKPVMVGNTLEPLISAAAEIAQRCASSESPTVFCPPIATFINSTKADEASLANGLALSVECDQSPLSARQMLEGFLSAATIIVQSGGEWPNPVTGKVENKLHLHWRLNKPTRTLEEHKLLKEARTLATALVGGDASNKPIVHPIRWPGSWHRKKSPKLAQIISETDNEIDLHDVVEKLRDALDLTGIKVSSNTEGTEYSCTFGEIRDDAALIEEITSGREYHAPLIALAMRYIKRGMADKHVELTLCGIMKGVPERLRDMKDGIQSPGRWQSRYDDIPRAVSTARDKINAEEKEWPDPNPIESTLLPVKPFAPQALLPSPLATFVTDTAERMLCPPDYVAAAVMGALGSLIGARCAIKPKSHDDWVVVPNLWGAVVGNPSVKKTPAINAALKPLDRLIARAMEFFNAKTADYDTEKMLRNARKKHLQGELNKTVKTEAAKIGDDNDEEEIA